MLRRPGSVQPSRRPDRLCSRRASVSSQGEEERELAVIYLQKLLRGRSIQYQVRSHKNPDKSNCLHFLISLKNKPKFKRYFVPRVRVQCVVLADSPTESPSLLSNQSPFAIGLVLSLSPQMFKGKENHLNLIQEVRTENALQKAERQLLRDDVQLVKTLTEQRDAARHEVE